MAPVQPGALDPQRIGVPRFQHPVNTTDAAIVERVVLQARSVPDDDATPRVARQRGAGRHKARPVLDQETDARPSQVPSSDMVSNLAIFVKLNLEGAILVVPGLCGFPLHALCQKLHRDTVGSVDLCFWLHKPRFIREGRGDSSQHSLGVFALTPVVHEEVSFIEDHQLDILDALQGLPASHLILAGAGRQPLRSRPRCAYQNVRNLLWPAAPGIEDRDGRSVSPDVLGQLLGHHRNLHAQLQAWHQDQRSRMPIICRARGKPQDQLESRHQVGQGLP
mmetsp:Transcript_34806/g.80172  ORF Transcript_34806/g.80172 Transcript_34806/m.80172 type:complete len:278 (-) Transcript_34806:762-1595(-)